MEKKESFGSYIRSLRRNREKTLNDVANSIGVSLSFLSDIEQDRRNPFDEERMAKFVSRLMLKPDEAAKLYDLAADRKNGMPDDLKETIMYAPESDFVRIALRKSKAGEISKEDWIEFINKKRGDE